MGMMMQLAGDSELRAAAERLMTSLKDAGIHVRRPQPSAREDLSC